MMMLIMPETCMSTDKLYIRLCLHMFRKRRVIGGQTGRLFRDISLSHERSLNPSNQTEVFNEAPGVLLSRKEVVL